MESFCSAFEVSSFQKALLSKASFNRVYTIVLECMGVSSEICSSSMIRISVQLFKNYLGTAKCLLRSMSF